MIKAVIFDFDGLIIDTETVWYHSFREALANHGVELSLEEFAPFIGTHGSAFDRYLAEKVANQAQLAEVKRLAGELHREKIQHVDARDGVRAYLTEAKDLGLRIGLASSSNREWVEEYLRKLQLLSFFEVIKTEDDVREVKPNPELYLKAVSALEILPSEAIAFEDSAIGAKAAKAAGVHCVIVPNGATGLLTFENYDLRIESMADQSLADVVRRMEGIKSQQ